MALRSTIIASACIMLSGCAELVTPFNQWDALHERQRREQQQQQQAQAPQQTAAEKCYEIGAVEGTPEQARCVAGFDELWAMSEEQKNATSDAQACAKLALGGTPIYLNCLEVNRRFHAAQAEQAAADAERQQIESDRQRLATYYMLQNLNNQAHEFTRKQQPQGVQCRTNTYGSTTYTNCQ